METASRTPRARTLRRNASNAENYLWYVLKNRSLAGHKFVRQLPVGPYFADFACREAGLIVEIDGGQHSGAVRDRVRTAYLNAEGYSVLRFWNNDVLQNRDGVLDAILRTMAGNPSPDWRFAPADLSPTGRGSRGARASRSAHAARAGSTPSNDGTSQSGLGKTPVDSSPRRGEVGRVKRRQGEGERTTR